MKEQKRNLLILGAGTYGLVAKEIAESMACFSCIDFADDALQETATGIKAVGNFADLSKLSKKYTHMVVAIGNPEIRLTLLRRIEEETDCEIATLLSPHAYVSPSAKMGKGCIVEPMAVVHTACVLGIGCIISAGAVLNHLSECGDGVHVDCNATVEGYAKIPAGMKVRCGSVFYSNI